MYGYRLRSSLGLRLGCHVRDNANAKVFMFTRTTVRVSAT